MRNVYTRQDLLVYQNTSDCFLREGKHRKRVDFLQTKNLLLCRRTFRGSNCQNRVLRCCSLDMPKRREGFGSAGFLDLFLFEWEGAQPFLYHIKLGCSIILLCLWGYKGQVRSRSSSNQVLCSCTRDRYSCLSCRNQRKVGKYLSRANLDWRLTNLHWFRAQAECRDFRSKFHWWSRRKFRFQSTSYKWISLSTPCSYSHISRTIQVHHLHSSLLDMFQSISRYSEDRFLLHICSRAR